jgi:hypothetical protein
MHLNVPKIFFEWRRTKTLKQFTFCHYIDNFSPWEDIVRKLPSLGRFTVTVNAD